MEDYRELDSYIKLYKAIIVQAYTDITIKNFKGNGDKIRAIQFVNSPYFYEICEYAGISNPENIKKKMNKMFKL